MKRIFLILIPVSFFLFAGTAVLASCDPPTGTISVDKPTVGSREAFKITVIGWDDNDVQKLFTCYFDSANRWQCKDHKCWGNQQGPNDPCKNDWTFSLPAPGTYTFYGKVWDSDSEHGCLSSHEASTAPPSVQVTVERVANPCQEPKCGLNLESTCLCGNTPIERGKLCCASYGGGEGRAFDNSTVCLTQCPGAVIEACQPNCEAKSTGTCLCGDNVINQQYCCQKLERGYNQQETCNYNCGAVLPSCGNLTCQAAAAQDCLCGSTPIKAGEFCCAASDKGYSSKALCGADIKCAGAVNTCNQLYGVWCPLGTSCQGSNLTSKASDSTILPDQVCCSGTCVNTCLNGIREAGEKCDGSDLAGQTCQSLGYSGGSLACQSNCASFNTSACVRTGQPPFQSSQPSQSAGGDSINLRDLNPLKAQSIQELIGAVHWFVWRMAVAIAPIMFIIAGLLFITSAGDTGRLRTAKNLFFYTVIGLAVVLLASGLYEVLKSILGG